MLMWMIWIRLLFLIIRIVVLIIYAAIFTFIYIYRRNSIEIINRNFKKTISISKIKNHI